MQNKVFEFVKNNSTRDGKTLDVGSLDVNGSVRGLFDDYTGIDMREGKNVDIVANSHNLPFDDNTFDRIVCVETLEHDDNPFETIKEIKRVLKDGGQVILAASGISFPKHSYPSDYWRFTKEGLGVLLENFEEVKTFEDNDEAFAVGICKK